jgi:hypothetical protein
LRADMLSGCGKRPVVQNKGRYDRTQRLASEFGNSCGFDGPQ